MGSPDCRVPTALLLGLLGRDGLVHRVVDAENLRQPGNPEDLEYPLLRADQVQGAVVGAHPLQPADQHPETGGVEELHLLHVDDELVVVLVDQVDEQLTEPRRRVHIDLALDIDDLDAVLVVVTELQIHKSSSAIKASSPRSAPAQPGSADASARGAILCGIQPRSDVMSIRNHAFGHPPTGDTLRKLCLPSRVFPRSRRAPRPPYPLVLRPIPSPRTARWASCWTTPGRASPSTWSTSRGS